MADEAYLEKILGIRDIIDDTPAGGGVTYPRQKALRLRGAVKVTPTARGIDLEFAAATQATATTVAYVQPAVGDDVTLAVLTSKSAIVGQALFVAGGGYYVVASIPDDETIVATNTGAGAIASPGATVAVGAAVSAAGAPGQGDVIGPASAVLGRLPLIDSVTGKQLADGGVGLRDIGQAFHVSRYGGSPTASAAANVDALNAAIDAANAAGGADVVFADGSYSMGDGTIVWKDGARLRGAGIRRTTLDFSARATYAYSAGIILMQGGGRSNVQGVTANVARGALSCAVADGSGYTSGDIVQMRSTENYVPSDGGTRAEFLRVRYVNGNTVYFTTPVVEVYDTGLGTVQLAKIAFATGSISDLTIKGKGVNPAGVPTPTYTGTIEVNDSAQNTRGDFGIECRWGRDLAFDRVRFVDVENQCIVLQSCFGFSVSSCVFEFSAITVRSQYGIAIYRGTANGRIFGNLAINCRHFVTTGHTSETSEDYYFGVPIGCTIEGNIVLGSWQAGIDLHRGGYNFVVVGNYTQGYYTGIKTRASRVLIADNIVHGPNPADRVVNYDGIQVFYNVSDVTVSGNKISGHDCGIRVGSPDGDAENILIEGNTIQDCGAYGIRISTGANTFRRVKVAGNIIDTPATYGVFPDGNFVTLSVDNNQIFGGTYGVRTNASGSYSGVSCQGNQIRGTTNEPLYLEVCTSLTVNGNQLYGANSNGVHLRLRDCKRGTVAANYVEIPTGASGGNGIFLNATGSGTCADLTLSGNEVYSLSGVGTGINLDDQANQYHLLSGDNNCRTCATPFDTSTDNTIRNDAAQVSSTRTIASGVITAPAGRQTLVIVDTEGAASSDDLDTVSYTGRIGDRISVRSNADARDVVLKDGTGNLRLAGDCTLGVGNDSITLEWRGSTWSECARSING